MWVETDEIADKIIIKIAIDFVLQITLSKHCTDF